MIGSAIIAITLVPMLMTIITRGKYRLENKNPVTKHLNNLYAPIIRLALKWHKTTIAINIIALLITIMMIINTGSEFMPSLDEGRIRPPNELFTQNACKVYKILKI